jgi:Thaumatin family
MASSALLPLLLSSCLFFSLGNAATFTIINQCSYTIWAAASPGGGRQLNSGGTWTLNVAAGTTMGRIWGRTGCSFDSSGNGHCQSGDCGKLVCTGWGTPPNTLAEYALNQFNNLDFYDISLIDGFNIPMNFVPVSGCNSAGAHCSADVNSQCPNELKRPGGCLNACQVFPVDQYCCNSGTCGPTNYSRFFKGLCPQAYSYPKDDATSTFTCPGGTNYQVVFCPVKLQEEAGSSSDVVDN